MSIAIRIGGALDIDPVMTVMDAAFDPCFGEAWNRGQCLGILSLPDVWLMLAEEGGVDGACVGFSLSRRTADESELLLLAVHPEARGQGVGRALVDAVADNARARGATRLMLEMRDGNDALRLYEGAGFAPIGRRRAYYRGASGELRDAITLSRSLVN